MLGADDADSERTMCLLECAGKDPPLRRTAAGRCGAHWTSAGGDAPPFKCALDDLDECMMLDWSAGDDCTARTNVPSAVERL